MVGCEPVSEGINVNPGGESSQGVDGATLCEARDISIRYATRNQSRAVDGVSLAIGRHEKVCVVGESGSGKTTLALAIAGLLPASARIETGVLRVLDVDIAAADGRTVRRLCSKHIGWVPQDPLSSLNPVFRIKYQLSQALPKRPKLTRKQQLARMEDALGTVRLRDPERVLAAYPHELSGGMRQRVLIAAALLKEPSLLIADEPTTALDATVQVEILLLLREVVEQRGLTLLMVTHDLAVASAVADQIYVMWQGRVVESGKVDDVLAEPRAAYTRRLIEASAWKGLGAALC